MSVRLHNIKIWLRYCEGFDKPYVTPSFPMFFDLGSDPRENFSLFDDRLDCGWELAVALELKQEYEKSIEAMPNIKPGTGDNFNGYGLVARGEHDLEVKAEKKAGVQTM